MSLDACSACAAGRSCTRRGHPDGHHRHRHLLRLTDKPHQAKFLTQQERDWLVAKIASENRAKEAVRIYSLFESMVNPKVLLLALNYIGIVTASLAC